MRARDDMQRSSNGRDIQLFGAVFITVGLIDLMIIEFFPAYALRLFGLVVSGPAAYAVKLHSPVVHFLVGYGFLFFRPWSWGLALAYGAFGMVSEFMNQSAFGFHPVRSGFMATTALFMAYLVWRRSLFVDQDPTDRSIAPPAPEVPS